MSKHYKYEIMAMNVFEGNNTIIGVCPVVCFKATTVTRKVWYRHQNKQLNETIKNPGTFKSIDIYKFGISQASYFLSVEKDELVFEWYRDSQHKNSFGGNKVKSPL